MSAIVLLSFGGIAKAAVGDTLNTLTPSPSGNGRALTIDPSSGHLFYTNYGDPHIYVIDTSGKPVTTLSPNVGNSLINYGALSWQHTSSGGILWGGRYDGSGWVDKIDPSNGQVTPAFHFTFPAGDSCYSQSTGFTDGLAFDTSDNTLWLGDDAAKTFFHVRTDGSTIASFATPNGLCRSGIAVGANFLWLGLQNGPDQPPYEVGRVAKNAPSTLLQTLGVSDNGPEGLALDYSTFPGKCALWTNQFGDSTLLTARELPKGQCNAVASFPTVPTPSLKSVGLLTFHTFDDKNNPVVRGCVATVVNSANLSTIITAAHCVAGAVAFGGSSNAKVTNLEFAPAHTGACWPGNPPQTSQPQIDVDKCGKNPFGVWYANPSDVFVSSSYILGAKDNPDDFAYIVVRPRAGGTRVQEAVGGFDITWDTNSNPATDPLQTQTWRVSSYASDDPTWYKETNVFGPYECDWNGTTSGTSPSASRLGAVLSNACSSVDPMSGATVGLNYPSDKDGAFGSSGSPWTNDKNAPNSEVTIGAIETVVAFNCTASPCLRYIQGTKLGTDAQNELNMAQAVPVN